MKLLVLLGLTVVLAGSAWAGESAYARKIAEQPQVTEAEGIVLVSFLLGNRSIDVASAEMTLRAKGAASEPLVKDRPLTAGRFALWVMRSKKWNGGLLYAVFGGTRYAWRELVYRGVLPAEGSEYSPLSGGKLVAALSRVAPEASFALEKKEIEDHR